VTEDEPRRKRKKAAKVAVRVRSADGSMGWGSITERTERQAARMKNVRRDVVLVERRVAPPVRQPTAAELMDARITAARLAPRPRKLSRLERWANSTVAAREAFRHRPDLSLFNRLWLATFDDTRLRARDERETKARAEARAEASRTAARSAEELRRAQPAAALDRLLRDADRVAAEETYRSEVHYDAAHPERRKRWAVHMAYNDDTRNTHPNGWRNPSHWERDWDTYDNAVRSGELRRWWDGVQRRDAEEKARWVSAMALKHPGADPSEYGVLAQQDAKREQEAQEAAHYRGLAVDREREEKRRLEDAERALRSKYGIPEGVPVFPPKSAPSDPTATGARDHNPTTTVTPFGRNSGGGIQDSLKPEVFPPINPPINPPPSEVLIRPPGPSRGEPAQAVSPKASSDVPSAGAGAVPEARDGSEPVPLAPSLPERRSGRPRVHHFNPSEARWLKSLGFTVAEVVRMLGLPDTDSARRLVRAAVRE